MTLLKIEWTFFYIAILKVKRYLGHQDNRGWKALSYRSLIGLEKFKLVSNGNIFGLYGIWSRDQPDLYLHTHPKKGILFVKCLAYRSKIYDRGYGYQNVYANAKIIRFFSVFMPCPLSRGKSLSYYRWGT